MKKLILILILGCNCIAGWTAKKETISDYNFRKALELLMADTPDPIEGLKFLNLQLEQTPNMADALLLRSIYYCGEEVYAKALVDINRAIKMHTKNDQWSLWVLYETRADIYSSLGQKDKAVSDYTMALKVIPKTETNKIQDVLFDRAQIYYEQKDYALADADYQLMLRNNEAELRAMIGLARNMLGIQNYEGALTLLNHCESFDVNYPETYKYRMQVYDKMEEPSKAIDDALLYYEKSDNPENICFLCIKRPAYALAQISAKMNHAENPIQWRLLKTTIYEKQHKYDQAIEEYNAIEEDAGVAPTLLYYRANAYAELGDTKRAVADLSHLLNQRDEYTVICTRGDVYRKGGAYEQAIVDYTNAIAKNPSQAYPYYARGWSYELMGDDAKAMENYNMGIDIDPSYSYLFLMRGEQYLKKGQTNLAYADFEQVLAKDTVVEDGSCRQYALHFLGRDAEAEQWMEQLIATDSLNSGYYYDKACLFGRMGRIDDAMGAIQRALEMGYRQFEHMEHDDDLDCLRDSTKYKMLIEEYRKRPLYPIDAADSTETLQLDTVRFSEIDMTRQGSGTYELPCRINELPLKLILDTGASTVSLSSVEANFMLKNGYLNVNDFRGKERFSTATGEVHDGTIVRLRTVQLGDLKLSNIEASVVHNQQAPLLLGQSLLERFGKITIDNTNSKLVIYKY